MNQTLKLFRGIVGDEILPRYIGITWDYNKPLWIIRLTCKDKPRNSESQDPFKDRRAGLAPGEAMGI